jgi:transposase-like protein
MQIEGFVFMSDREKGLPNALKAVFPNASPSYCCQHIADNLQAEYGVKCRPLFWKCARAKTKEAFETALQDLQSLNVNAANYIDRIPHEF